MMKLPPQVNTAFEMLEAAGYEAYLVGGAVRDYVRDNSPAKDWFFIFKTKPLCRKTAFVIHGIFLLLWLYTVSTTIGWEYDKCNLRLRQPLLTRYKLR